ncbi:MAG TPA: molybdate ABC transporter substrate-binding protein [Acidimicrobiales bacterium]|nr:molybdate ABC transporter substrate-binding protein [Acidimicrobiales bacterium]
MRSTVVALVLVLLAAACGAGGEGRGPVRVSAAASLSDAFGEMATAFEAAHPGTDVVLNLGGSSRLAEQIAEGAPVDAFASAAPAHMERLAAQGLVAEPVVIARNTMVIAVPPGNPAGITGPEDFARSDLVLGLCAPVVPCGEVAREALARAGVRPLPDTEEPDVRSLLTKIEEGELDGGIVYATDVTSAEGRVESVSLGPGAEVATRYSMAVVVGATNAETAARFTEFVLSPPGQEILARFGFGPP